MFQDEVAGIYSLTIKQAGLELRNEINNKLTPPSALPNRKLKSSSTNGYITSARNGGKDLQNIGEHLAHTL